MLWIINGLFYGFFMALYTIVNQKNHFNGYVLGVWRGFGISILFLPFMIYLPLPSNMFSWELLIAQGILIGIYDSHIFFASARYGAILTSRLLVLSVLLTMAAWWMLTPERFTLLIEKPELFMTLVLCVGGFCLCYWFMMKSKVSRQALIYMSPAIVALAAMSILTKEIALMGNAAVWNNIIYYLVFSTSVSGLYNLICLLITHKQPVPIIKMLFATNVVKTGIYIVGFSCALITAKTLAMRLAPNPAYVVTLLLTAPIFAHLLSDGHIKDKHASKAGISMIFFLIMLMLLVAGSFGVTD